MPGLRALEVGVTLFVVLIAIVSCEDDDPVAPSAPLVEVDIRPAWSPIANRIAYYHRPLDMRAAGIYLITLGQDDSVLSDSLLLPFSGDVLEEPFGLRFSPDGAELAYWLGHIMTLKLSSGEVRQILSTAGQNPDWHPSKREIIYNRGFASVDTADSGNIRIFDLTTEIDRPVKTGLGHVLAGSAPRWNPDGRSIAFSVAPPGGNGTEIYTVFPDSTEPLRLTVTGWLNERPHWFANGTRIVFSGQRPDGSRDTYVVDDDGSDLQILPCDTGHVGRFYEFSPDYTRMVITADDGSGIYGVLWIVRLNAGCEGTQITYLRDVE